MIESFLVLLLFFLSFFLSFFFVFFVFVYGLRIGFDWFARMGILCSFWVCLYIWFVKI